MATVNKSVLKTKGCNGNRLFLVVQEESWPKEKSSHRADRRIAQAAQSGHCFTSTQQVCSEVQVNVKLHRISDLYEKVQMLRVGGGDM